MPVARNVTLHSWLQIALLVLRAIMRLLSMDVDRLWARAWNVTVAYILMHLSCLWRKPKLTQILRDVPPHTYLRRHQSLCR
eukprot:2648-Eustigmatos_ZCMA.PRE.1